MKRSKYRFSIFLIITTALICTTIFPNTGGSQITKDYIKKINIEFARNIAQKHTLLLEMEDHKISDFFEIKDNYDYTLMYIFNLESQGYIVVTANRILPPIIAYSFSNNFGSNSDENILLNLLKTDISIRLNHQDKIPKNIVENRYELWAKYFTDIDFIGPHNSKNFIGPLLDTKWSQNSPYNDFCPIDLGSGTKSVAGCPAVAMAQILNYHRTTQNVQFDDNDDYRHNYGGNNYWIDDDHETYDFPSFPELNSYLQTLENHYENEIPLTDEDKAAINFACGVAAKQVYNPSGSGTFGVNQAYDAYLRFSFDDVELLDEDDEELYDRLQENILEGLPAHIAVVNEEWTVGHNMVVDGYNDGKYHINFGWGGPYDAWYDLPDELPYELTVIEGIVVDIFPNNAESDLEGKGVLGWSDVKIGSIVSGSFSIQNIGDSGSSIDWEIVSFPNWGTWTFSPESGEDLKPEDGEFNIDVTVIAPEEKEKDFAGVIKIANIDNSSDYCLIHASLTTPRIKNRDLKQIFFRENCFFQFLIDLLSRLNNL